MKITITGTPGSGKSSIGKMLAQRFDLRYYSIGDLMDKIAMEKHVSLTELSKLAEETDEVDKKLDGEQIKLKDQKEFIIDSRLGWFFIPNSIKLFLDVNIDEASKRIFNDNRTHEKENTDLETTKENIMRRIESERKRYKKYYEVDFYNPDLYDLFIDTTQLTKDEVYQKIVMFINEISKEEISKK